MGREERKAQNEVWFRDLNERLEARAVARSGPDAAFEIVCECALELCNERIAIEADAYEEVRVSSTRFILVPGHDDAMVERVVLRGDGYEIVEKLGVAASVADASDPRS